MNNNRSYNSPIKFLTFSLVLLTTLFTFMSCENFLQGEDVKEEITRAIEYNNSSAYAINVEALTGTGTIKTPATGEVVKKVTDTFTVRFEPAENHKFVRWEAVVKGMSTGEKAADYISFEDSESLETKVTFKKASAKTIVIRPVCPEYLRVSDFNLSAADKVYPKDSKVVLTFNKPINNDCIDTLDITIPGIDEGKSYRDYFKAPALRNNNELVVYADTDKENGPNYIPVVNGGNKIITVSIPKETFFYTCKDYLEPVDIYLEKDLNYTYTVNSSTTGKTKLKFFVDSSTKGNFRVDDENAESLSAEYSVGRTIALKYKPADGYFFDKWNISRTYIDEDGNAKTIEISLEDLNKYNLSIAYPENEATYGVDTVTNSVQAVLTINNYIDGTINVSPVNKPRVNIQFSVNDETQGTLKIDGKGLDNQDFQYSVGKSIQLKYKVADGYFFDKWLVTRITKDSSGSDISQPVTLDKLDKVKLSITYPENEETLGVDELLSSAQALIHIDDYVDGTIVFTPVNKPRVKVNFAVDDESQGVLKIDAKSIDNQALYYSLGRTIQVNYKPAEGYVFSHWQIKADDNSEVLVNSLGDPVLAALKATFKLKFSCPDEDNLSNVVITIDGNSERAITVKPVNKPRLNIQFTQDFKNHYEEYGLYKIDDIRNEESKTYKYSLGKELNLKFKLNEGYKFKGWSVSKIVKDEENNDILQNFDGFNSYITFSYDDNEYALIKGYSAETRTASANVSVINYCDETFVISPVITPIPKVSVTMDVADGVGTVSPNRFAGPITEGVVTAVDFVPSGDYEFVKWEFFDTQNNAPVGNSKFVSFSDPRSKKTEFKFTDVTEEVETNGFILRPVVAKRPKPISHTPTFESNGSRRDATIQVMFNHDMDTSSIYYTEEELGRLSYDRLLQVNNDINKTYGYEKAGERYFKNISITDNYDGSNLLKHFDAPRFENAKTLSIPVDISKSRANVLPEYTQVLVNISKNVGYMEDKTRVSMNTSEEWVYQVGGGDEALDTAAPTPDTAEGKFKVLQKSGGDSLNVMPSNSNLSTLKFLQNNQLYLDFAVNDQGGPSSTFKLICTKIYDGKYDEVQDVTKEIGLSYSGAISSRAVFKGNADLSSLDDGVYLLSFEFSDRSGNTAAYPENPTYYFTIDKSAPTMDAPTFADGTTEGKVNIRWDYSQCKDFTKAVIKYKQTSSSDDYQSIEVAKGTEQKELTLAGGSSYDFKVSYYDMNNNEKEYDSQFITRPNTPRNIIVNADNNNSGTRNYGDTALTLSAEKPEAGNFTSLRIGKRIQGSNTSWDYITLDNPDASNKFLQEYTGLANATKYEFEVCSFDEASGKYSLPYKSSNAYPTFITLPSAPSFRTLPADGAYTNQIDYTCKIPDSNYTKLFVYYRTLNETYSDSKRIDITDESRSHTDFYTYNLTSVWDAGTKYWLKLVTYYENTENKSESSEDWTFTRPNNARNLAMNTRTNDSITMKWDKPASGLYAAYQLMYKASSASSYTSINITDKNTVSYTLSGLRGGTNYDFKIRSKNANNGYSAESSVVTVQTQPNAPTNVAAVKNSSSEITLSWTNPTDVFTGVKIYKSVNEDFSGADEVTYTNGATSHKYTGLSSGITYYFKIRSYINTTLYTESDVISCSTSINPVSNYSLSRVSSTALKASWKNPDSFDGIRIYRNTTNNLATATLVTTRSGGQASASDSYTLTGLTPNYYYYVWAVAYKDVDGTEASVASLLSLRTYPSQVTGLKVVANSPTKVTLSWTNPTSSYFYKIKVYNGNELITTLDNTSTSYAIEGLTPGTSYSYYVRTTNNADVLNNNSSEPAPSLSITTPPAKVVGLSVTSSTTSNTATSAASASSVTLSWTKPEGSISRYEIYYKLSSASTYTYMTWVTGTSYTLSSLTAGKYYNFMVRSIVTGATNLSDGSSESVCSSYTPPNAPTNFSVNTQTTTSLKYTWTKPASGCSALRLYYRKNSGSWTYVSLNTSDTSYTFNNLTPGTNYEAYLWDYYSSSVYTNSTKTLSTYTKTAVPTNVNVSASGGGTKLTWSSSGAVEKYYVYYRKTNSGSWSSATSTTNSYTFNNSYLDNSTSYDFKVCAYNSGSGFSEESSIVSFYTPPTGLSSATLYSDDGMGTIKIRFYAPENTKVDYFIDDVYVDYSTFTDAGYKTKTFNLSEYDGVSYSRTKGHVIRAAPYHIKNTSSGDTAAWAKKFSNETYGTSVTVTSRTDGDLVVNGLYFQYTSLKNVITSRTYVNNTTSTNASHYDGAFPKNRYVYLSAYSIGQYEVTQDLYENVMGSNPSTVITWNYPVNNVSYYHAIAFCNKLSVLQGLKPCYVVSGYTDYSWQTMVHANVPTSDNSTWNAAYIDRSANGYRLPTECENEFAARGGSIYSYNWTYAYPGSDTLSNVAWIKDNSSGRLHKVGEKSGNGLSLYDMSGNVKEWLSDWNYNPTSGTYYDPYCGYSTSDYAGSSSSYSTLKKKESKVLLKGGYYGSNDNAWVDSNGDKWEPYKHDYSTGLRICRNKNY